MRRFGLFSSIVCLLIFASTLPLSAAQHALLRGLEDESLEFVEIREHVGDRIVYFHQRMIGGAEVEGDWILHHFHPVTHEKLDSVRRWRDDLPDALPDLAMDKGVAELLSDGEIIYSKLMYISPDSPVFPFDPAPTNPCWVVAHIDRGTYTLSVHDAITGAYVGEGIAPPSESFSGTGPQEDDPCSGAWYSWAESARNAFMAMGYTVYYQVWPSTEIIQQQIQSTETALFYELMHGDSDSFQNGCTSFIYSGFISTWIAEFEKMPFTFVGSCDGLCNTGPGGFSYAFRKGENEDTGTVGYCGMSTDPCGSCWGMSLYWQDHLFGRLEDGWTLRDAYESANSYVPVCVSNAICMRMAGDDDLTLVPKVVRGTPDGNWLSYHLLPLGDAAAGRSATWLDVDGDGLQDLYLSNDGSANALLMNEGALTFGDMSWGDLSDPGAGRGAAAGDVDNDGDPDLYVVNDGEPDLLLLNSNGYFSTATGGDLGDAGPGRAAAWADYDLDGDLDLYLARYGDTDLLLRNDGGTFNHDAGAFTPTADQSVACAWADYDLDGDPDLFLAVRNGANRLLRNDGGLLTDVAAGILADAGPAADCAWGDFDGDLDPDLAVANAGQRDLLLRNDGGVFVDTGALDAWVADTRGLAWGDYENDGDLDLAIARYDVPNLMLMNDGGVFTDVATGPLIEAHSAMDITWADPNEDGRQDLYLVRDGEINRLLRNIHPSDGHWLQLTLAGDTSNRSAIGARVELLAGGAWQSRGIGEDPRAGLTAAFGLGDATVADTLRIRWPSGIVQTMSGLAVDQHLPIPELSSPPWTDVATGDLADGNDGRGGAWTDFDGDGDMDLHIVNDGAADVLLENDQGAFTPATTGDLADVGAGRCPAWADFDNDGDADLYLPRHGEANRLLRNDAGLFTDIAAYGSEDAGPGTNAAWADYNNDGLLDLYLVNENAANLVMRSMGDPGIGQWILAAISHMAPDDGPGRAAAWGDYDLDGDQDLYVVNRYGPNVLYNYDPGAGFVEMSSGILADTGPGVAAAWGDYDGDGDPDLYLANDGSIDRLMRNDGGSFSRITGGDLGDDGAARSVHWLDFDNDGDLDIFLARHDEANLMLENENGAFTSVPFEVPAFGYPTNCALPCDWDVDGDLDLYLVGEGANRLLENNLTGGGNWLSLHLVGEMSNRSAVGARVRMVAGALTSTRWQTAGAGGGGQGTPRLHLGLGAAAAVDSLIIDWPAGTHQVFVDLPANQRLTILEVAGISGVGDEAPSRPGGLALRCAPNPFNPSTRIYFDLPRAAAVDLTIYDLAGREVRRLLSGAHRAAGPGEVQWDGRDDAGRAVSSGGYLCRVSAGGEQAAIRLVLVR